MVEGKVLIIEDSRSIAGLLEEKMEKVGLNTHFAHDHKGAYEYLMAYQYTAFVTNMNWPDKYWDSCLDMAEEQNIPVLVFSSTFTEDIHNKISQMKIYDHIVKRTPQSLDKLVESIITLHENKEIGVIVVDDSVSIREYTIDLFKRANFIPFSAKDGFEGLKILKENKNIKLIIVDYEMPGMNGFEFTEKVRENFTRNEIAIIGFTRSTTEITTAGFLKHGANDFLYKPFSPDEFFARVKTNLEMIKAYGQLQHISKFKDKILGIVAHDLRNPIASISGCMEIIKMDTSIDATNKELIGYIDQACQSMTTLVNDLLDVSMIESGQLDIKISEFNLYELLEERVSFFNMKAKKKEILLKLVGVDIVVKLDRQRIVQVIDNLLSNALKYTTRGGEVTVSLERSESIKVSISDSGPGLSDEDMKKLFGEFQRLSAKPTGGESSFGLGLAIVKKIVSAHDGRIGAYNNDDKGATFYVEFPEPLL
ncbi:hybrid sensor histidine kinase/response regulator [Spirochaeta cellobiosiphila]|uniref:hybrid sensor histidine kinase/response regulator n=1 Tax=Spirochaeta cellobiosiphila TaxID=504483 RepID=UPI0003F9DEC9|nr:hybrid sensor histidine kinase/response regulator [Spirochaeta cellobiosiphila]